jgi:hypothetical protein
VLRLCPVTFLITVTVPKFVFRILVMEAFICSRLGDPEMHDSLSAWPYIFLGCIPTFSCFCWPVDTYLQCVSRTCSRQQTLFVVDGERWAQWASSEDRIKAIANPQLPQVMFLFCLQVLWSATWDGWT